MIIWTFKRFKFLRLLLRPLLLIILLVIITLPSETFGDAQGSPEIQDTPETPDSSEDRLGVRDGVNNYSKDEVKVWQGTEINENLSSSQL